MPCDEGYTPVFGGLCVKTTTLKKVYNPKTPPAVHPYTSPACEAALSALGSASSAMDAALAVPKKLFAQARRLLGIRRSSPSRPYPQRLRLWRTHPEPLMTCLT